MGKFQIEVTILPSVGSDDIEEGQANAGNMYMGSSDLEFGYDSYNEQGYQKVGIRFDDLMIPKRAEIVSSTIEFYGKYDQAEPAQTTIYLENTDNAAAFTSTPYDLTNRDYIAESIVWDIPAWTKKGYGAETQTPDLSALLNQLITQDSWNNHSSVVFKFEPSGPSLENEENKRTAYSRDKYTDAYFLLVTYTYDAAAKLSTTETPQEASSLTYKIYPNPASDKIMIFGMAELVENTTVLGVFNMVGQKMNCSTRRINNSEVEVSVEDLRSGVYFIKVLNHANNQISSHKFIKK